MSLQLLSQSVSCSEVIAIIACSKSEAMEGLGHPANEGEPKGFGCAVFLKGEDHPRYQLASFGEMVDMAVFSGFDFRFPDSADIPVCIGPAGSAEARITEARGVTMVSWEGPQNTLMLEFRGRLTNAAPAYSELTTVPYDDSFPPVTWSGYETFKPGRHGDLPPSLTRLLGRGNLDFS